MLTHQKEVPCWDRGWQCLDLWCGSYDTLTGTSTAGWKLEGCETISPSGLPGHRLIPGISSQPLILSFQLWLCRFMSNPSAYGHAVISEVQLIFIRCFRLQFYKQMQHASAEAPKKSCVLLSHTSYGKPVLHCCLICALFLRKTLFFYLIITRFIIYYYDPILPRCDLTTTKLAHSMVSKKTGHLPRKTTNRVDLTGYPESYSMWIKHRINALNLTKKLFPLPRQLYLMVCE